MEYWNDGILGLAEWDLFLHRWQESEHKIGPSSAFDSHYSTITSFHYSAVVKAQALRGGPKPGSLDPDLYLLLRSKFLLKTTDACKIQVLICMFLCLFLDESNLKKSTPFRLCSFKVGKIAPTLGIDLLVKALARYENSPYSRPCRERKELRNYAKTLRVGSDGRGQLQSWHRARA